ncbi:MAG: hypothetical protein H6719_14145 [Sandaracinaceae bacterium]|nr:hypothetical protein [Sandaracinaceae bacterium]
MLVALFGVVALASPGRAFAQIDEDFRQAREAYANGDTAEVLRLLEPLVGSAVPSIGDHVMAREARKYLAAAHVLSGAVERGEQQFRWLLAENRDQLRTMQLDRRVFIQEVREVFERIQAEMIAAEEEAQQDAEATRAAAQERRREALVALLAQAQEDVVVVENDELPMFVPFGVGQFVNGDEELGWLFALSEGAFVLAAFATQSAAWYINANLREMDGRIVRGYDALLGGLSIANLVTAAVFVVLAVAGVIEARLSWQPTRTIRRRREIDPEILDRLELGLGDGAGVGFRF